MLGQQAEAAAETQNQIVGLAGLLALAAVTATEAGLAVKKVRKASLTGAHLEEAIQGQTASVLPAWNPESG